jgi:hypothetical protein
MRETLFILLLFVCPHFLCGHDPFEAHQVQSFVSPHEIKGFHLYKDYFVLFNHRIGQGELLPLEVGKKKFALGLVIDKKDNMLFVKALGEDFPSQPMGMKIGVSPVTGEPAYLFNFGDQKCNKGEVSMSFRTDAPVKPFTVFSEAVPQRNTMAFNKDLNWIGMAPEKGSDLPLAIRIGKGYYQTIKPLQKEDVDYFLEKGLNAEIFQYIQGLLADKVKDPYVNDEGEVFFQSYRKLHKLNLETMDSDVVGESRGIGERLFYHDGEREFALSQEGLVFRDPNNVLKTKIFKQYLEGKPMVASKNRVGFFDIKRREGTFFLVDTQEGELIQKINQVITVIHIKASGSFIILKKGGWLEMDAEGRTLREASTSFGGQPTFDSGEVLGGKGFFIGETVFSTANFTILHNMVRGGKLIPNHSQRFLISYEKLSNRTLIHLFSGSKVIRTVNLPFSDVQQIVDMSSSKANALMVVLEHHGIMLSMGAFGLEELNDVEGFESGRLSKYPSKKEMYNFKEEWSFNLEALKGHSLAKVELEENSPLELDGNKVVLPLDQQFLFPVKAKITLKYKDGFEERLSFQLWPETQTMPIPELHSSSNFVPFDELKLAVILNPEKSNLSILQYPPLNKVTTLRISTQVDRIFRFKKSLVGLNFKRGALILIDPKGEKDMKIKSLRSTQILQADVSNEQLYLLVSKRIPDGRYMSGLVIMESFEESFDILPLRIEAKERNTKVHVHDAFLKIQEYQGYEKDSFSSKWHDSFQSQFLHQRFLLIDYYYGFSFLDMTQYKPLPYLRILDKKKMVYGRDVYEIKKKEVVLKKSFDRDCFWDQDKNKFYIHRPGQLDVLSYPSLKWKEKLKLSEKGQDFRVNLYSDDILFCSSGGGLNLIDRRGNGMIRRIKNEDFHFDRFWMSEKWIVAYKGKSLYWMER